MSPCRHIRTGFIALADCFRLLMYLNYMRMLSDLRATLFKICTHYEFIFLPVITIAITHHHHHHIQLYRNDHRHFHPLPTFQPSSSIFAVRLPLRDFDESSPPRDMYVGICVRNNVDVDGSDDDMIHVAHVHTRSLPSLLRLSFEIDSNEVMDEYFPALCTPQALMPLLRDSPQETLLDPGIYGSFSFSRLPQRCCVTSC